jgi:hypothetical protein
MRFSTNCRKISEKRGLTGDRKYDIIDKLSREGHPSEKAAWELEN